MKSRAKSLTIIALILSTTFLSQCTDSEHEAGSLRILMTDAPFPSDLVEEANVTISKIEIRRAGKGDGNPFLTLSEEEASYNLLDLTNGVTASLVDLDIPQGSYDLVRLYVAEASVKLADGTTYDLTVPSGGATGIKIFIDPSIAVVGGLSAELLLDFDVSRSFVVQGNPDTPAGINGFIFTPVIKASNKSTAGSLVGTVLDSLDAPLADVQISIFAEDTLKTTTFTNESGDYMVLGLLAGEYDVMVESGDYAPVTAESIMIEAANTTTLDFNLEE